MTNLFGRERELAVAMVQCEAIDVLTRNDLLKNVNALRDWVKWCVNAYEGIDLIVFPECSLQGSHSDMPPSQYVSIPDETTSQLMAACDDHNVWAVFNVLEKSEESSGQAYNVSFVVDNKGEVVLKQKKINPFVPTENSRPGDHLSTCVGPKGSRLGIMTCYDADFPEVARELAFQGANVLLRPSSYMEPYSEPWVFVNQARAYENLAYVVAVNRTGITNRYNWFGGSMAVGIDGKILTRAPHGTPWVTKVDLNPAEADLARKEAKVHNHLYNLKHRGYVGMPQGGDESNPYSVYTLWK